VSRVTVQNIEDLKPVYLIFGKEELLLEHAVRRLRERVAEVADLDFNFVAVDGESADPDVIVADANTLPFNSERRLIIVRGVDRMRADQQEVLAEYAKSPSPTTCLVLVAGKIAKNSRLYKAVDALGGAVEYKAPERSEYPRRVMESFEEKGRRITRDGADALLRAVGPDLRRLEMEVDKIVAYAGERTTLDRDDVQSVVAGAAPTSVFDLLNAMGARDCAAALAALDGLLADGEQLTGVHAMAVRHLRMLISTRALLDRGATSAAIMRELKLQDWQARNAIRQAGRFEPIELTRALRDAAETDANLKSGQGEPRVLFEMWLVGVCQRTD